MQLQILRAGGAHADGVNARGVQAEEIVEHDRMQGRAQLQQARRGGVQMAALIGGADHKHAHIARDCRLNGGPVVLADEIPVKVDVIEGVALDRQLDQL